MLSELKQITKSQKLRALMLFVVLAIVAAVVVFAIDGAGEYHENDGHYGYSYGYSVSEEGLYIHDTPEYGNHYDAYYSDDEYCIIRAAFDEYMYNMAGEAGEAPAMLNRNND